MNAKGLVMAVAMLVVQLLAIVLYAQQAPEVAVFMALFAVLQLVGIFLTSFGAYRAGGVVQIVASALFVPIGILGIVGGMRSWRYPEEARLRQLTDPSQPAYPYGPQGGVAPLPGQPTYPTYGPPAASQPYAPPRAGGPAHHAAPGPWPSPPIDPKRR